MATLAEKSILLLAKVKTSEGQLTAKLSDLQSESEKLIKAAWKVAESWSGSYAGYHSELYYRDFEKPPLDDRFSPEWGGINGIPHGWQPREPEEVKNRIETLAGIRLDLIEAGTKELVKEVEVMQNDIIVELASLHNATGFERERSLLEQLEQLQWERNIGEYIHANTPQNFMSRDSEAMMQGIKVPAHLYYDASAHVSRGTLHDHCGLFQAFRAPTPAGTSPDRRPSCLREAGANRYTNRVGQANLPSIPSRCETTHPTSPEPRNADDYR